MHHSRCISSQMHHSRFKRTTLMVLGSSSCTTAPNIDPDPQGIAVTKLRCLRSNTGSHSVRILLALAQDLRLALFLGRRTEVNPRTVENARPLSELLVGDRKVCTVVAG